MEAHSRRVRRSARHQRAADDDRRADDQGEGRLVRRRQGRLARQGRSRRAKSSIARWPNSRRAVRARAPTGVNLTDADRQAGSRPAAADAWPKPSAPPPTRRASRSRRVKPTASRSPNSAKADSAWWRSTPTSRTPPSATSSRRTLPDRFYQNFIAEQVMLGIGDGSAPRGAIPFPSTFAVLPHPRRRTSCGWPRSATSPIKMAGTPRRRLDWRGRPVADGARGSGDVPRAAELRGPLSLRCRQHRAACRAAWPFHPVLPTCAPAARRRQ